MQYKGINHVAIEYIFGTTAELTTEELTNLLTDTIGATDSIDTSSPNEIWLTYEHRMSVNSYPPTFTPDSPGQTHWKRTLGNRPQIIITFRFTFDEDVDFNHIAMIKFIAEFLQRFQDDAVFYISTSDIPALLRYKGKIAVNADDAYWAKAFENLDQAYSLVSDPRPDSADSAN